MSKIAFVLQSEAELPDPQQVQQLYESFGEPSLPLSQQSDDAKADPTIGPDPEEAIDLQMWMLGDAQMFVGKMPAPVPGGEAEVNAATSLMAVNGGWEVPACNGHLIVTWFKTEVTSEQLHAFTKAVAAVAKAANAEAVYWGEGIVTHPTDFFVEAAVDNPLLAWNGISFAQEANDRVSVLSLGMAQLGLPDLMVEADADQLAGVFEFFLDILAYVYNRGQPIAHGETLGRTQDEKLRVQHKPSPAIEDQTCMFVSFPSEAS